MTQADMRRPDADPGRCPILFLHGAVQTRAVWAQQIAAVSPFRQVVAPDLRGHGQTPLGDEPLSIGLMADDAVALLDSLGIPAAIVCGVSLGGMVALEMAARAPDRVAALVLANTPRALSPNWWVRRIVDALDPHRLLPPLFRLLGQERTARLGLAFARRIVGPAWVGQTARRHFIAGFTLMSEPSIVATYGAIVNYEPVDLGLIRCPCLVIDGTDDAPSIREQAEEIAGDARGASIQHIKAGHVANLDDPDEFNRILLDFLDRMDAGTA